VLVRFAEPADRPFIVQMACLATTLEDSPLPAADDPAVQELLPQSSDVALVAIDDQGQPSGAGWWQFANTPLLRGPDGLALPELVLAVLESDRGRGVGTLLIDALAKEAARRSLPALTLNVHLRNPATRLYTRTGFRVAGAGRGWFGVAMIRHVGAETDERPQAGAVSSFAAIAAAMAAERSRMLERLDAGLRGDERIVAAWVGGSMGRGEADDLSDIDIHLAVEDDQCTELNARRRTFVSGFGEPLLIQEAPQNAPPGGAFQLVLYRGAAAPIEVVGRGNPLRRRPFTRVPWCSSIARVDCLSRQRGRRSSRPTQRVRYRCPPPSSGRWRSSLPRRSPAASLALRSACCA
jgi:GNAT superfamily N-acetyltransferase